MARLAPVHPGAILAEEFLAPMRLDLAGLAKGLGLRSQTLQPILDQAAPVTADVALRLSRYFGTTPEFWLNLQVAYDLAIAQDRLATRIEREVRPYSGDR